MPEVFEEFRMELGENTIRNFERIPYRIMQQLCLKNEFHPEKQKEYYLEYWEIYFWNSEKSL